MATEAGRGWREGTGTSILSVCLWLPGASGEMSKTGTGAVVMTAAVVTGMGRRGVRSSSSETAGTRLGEEGQGGSDVSGVAVPGPAAVRRMAQGAASGSEGGSDVSGGAVPGPAAVRRMAQGTAGESDGGAVESEGGAPVLAGELATGAATGGESGAVESEGGAPAPAGELAAGAAVGCDAEVAWQAKELATGGSVCCDARFAWQAKELATGEAVCCVARFAWQAKELAVGGLVRWGLRHFFGKLAALGCRFGDSFAGLQSAGGCNRLGFTAESRRALAWCTCDNGGVIEYR